MKFPENPRPGKSVAETISEILNWIRANNVVGINGARGTESPNGKTFIVKTPEVVSTTSSSSPKGPFHLTVSKDGETWKFTVAGAKSSITDGTNGDSVTITGLDSPTTISATKFIMITAGISEALAATGWAVEAVDEADVDEVGFDASDPPKQDKLRVLVGKVTFTTEGEGEEAVESAVASQALFSNVIATHGILDGVAVRVADMASANSASL